VFVVVAILEPIVYGYVSLPDAWEANVPLSYVFGVLTVILTVWSGINYFVGLWKYLDPEK
jgi:phosphatidylglycerophosphate synthase